MMHRNGGGYGILVVAFLNCLLNAGLAQAPDTLWTKTYGGTGGDYSFAVQQTSDGGYAIMGYTNSFGAGNSDFYLVKTDANGDTIYTRTFGGPNKEVCYAGQQTSDGGYIMTGSTGIGYTNSDLYMVKADSLGNLEWTKTYGLGQYDQARSIEQTLDGGYVLAGYTSAGQSDVWLLKTDTLGDTLWTKIYGGSSTDRGWSVRQTNDGGYIVAGHTYSFGNGGVWLLKTDEYGDTVWSGIYGYADYWGRSVEQTSDGGYVVSGEDANIDLYLLKTDSMGVMLWSRVYVANGYNGGHSIKQTTDGGYVTVTEIGYGQSDLWFLKIDSLGDTLWTRTYGGAGGEIGWAIALTSDGGYIITGETSSFGAGSIDFYVLKIAPDTLGTTERQAKKLAVHSLTISPNPFVHKTNIIYQIPYASDNASLEIYDAAGRLVKEFCSMPYTLCNTISWDGKDRTNRQLGVGVYFVKLTTDDYCIIEKIVLIK